MSKTSFPKRSYIANAVAGTLSASMTSTSTTFTSATSLSAWEDVWGGSLSGQIIVCVEPETANEEKIAVTYSAGTFTIVQRNFNGETSFNYESTAHASGSAFIVVWSATEAAEVQAAVQALILALDNSGNAEVPVAISIGGSNNAGSSQYAAPVDHVHALSGASLADWFEENDIAVSISAANVTYGINEQNSNYETVSADAGNIIVCTNTGSITITVNTSLLSVGQSITIVRAGSGGVTVTGTSIFSNGATSGSPQLRAVGSACQVIDITPAGYLVTGDII